MLRDEAHPQAGASARAGAARAGAASASADRTGADRAGGGSSAGSGMAPTLTAALDVGGRELVALVGGGGKSAVLQLLARELSVAGKVIAATTTGMLFSELAAIGTVILEDGKEVLSSRLSAALVREPVVGVARRPGPAGKVVGVPPDWLDVLWILNLAPHLLVEADGSRGLPLKGFGQDEPQVPGKTTVIAQIAGLDVLGASLTEQYVHRADVVAAGLGIPLGARVTPQILAECLRHQLRTLRQRWPRARVVSLLNKAEGPDRWAQAREVAQRLLTTDEGAQPAAETSRGAGCPDAVVIASVHEGRFSRFRPGLSVAAIVLAAGRSTRIGGQKVLLPLGERALVEWVVDAALGSRADRTVVVVGHEAAEVRQALGDRPVTVVANPDYAQGMSTSIQVGIRALGPGCKAAIFMLADQPFVTSSLLDRLVEQFSQTQRWIVRPRVGTRPANPVLMSAELFAELLAQKGDVGGRDIARRHSEQVCFVQVDDPRVEMDVDSGEDYEAARRRVDGETVRRPDGETTNRRCGRALRRTGPV